jgi:signal transduction histidine kinase
MKSNSTISSLLVIILVFHGFSKLSAQITREQAIGAYIYNFANLSSSPAQDQLQEYTIAIVTENEQLIGEFRKMATDITIHDKKIELILAPVANIDFNTTCLVFIGEDKLDLYSQIYNKTKETEVLLVSENYTKKKEILLNIFDTDDNKLLFEINKGNIYQRNIRIKDEILMMGGTEIDLVELYLKSQQKLNASDSMLRVSNLNLKKLGDEMKITEREIEGLKAEITKQKEERQKLIDEILDYSKKIEIHKAEYNNSLKKLDSYNDSLKLAKNQIESSVDELRKFKVEIKIDRQKLNQLNNDIKQKEDILQEKNLIIRKQRSIVIFFVAGTIITSLLLLLLFNSFRNIRKKNKLLEKQKTEISKKNNELASLNGQFEQQNEELKITLEQVQRIQNQLIQSEKMASLGVLSAGIAHEINNPINFVYAGINSLLRDFEDIEPVLTAINKLEPDSKNLKEELKNIKQLKVDNYFDEAYEAIPNIIKDIKLGADRTAQIVQGLKIFSRMDKDQNEAFNIHNGLDTTLLLLKNKYKNHIEISKNYDNRIPEIYCYPGKINQAFMNILSNAIEAIADKGNIWITTTMYDKEITISIKDNGLGIPKDVLKKLYDPFFTTKDVGKGTGLGLSITYGIIKEHKGKIKVNSEQGKGSEFIITLPIQ